MTATDSGPPGVRATRSHAGASPITPPAPRRWATHAFQSVAAAPEAGLERFRLEAIQPVRGTRPSEWKPGMHVARRELSALRRPDPVPGTWAGVVDGHHSLPPDEAANLARAWSGNPFRVALLIACAHVSRFLTLKPEERGFDHLGMPDQAGAQRVPILRKIVRQLHRATPADDVTWDTMAYFEMLPEHVAHLREHLAERRELAALSDLVEREVEIWMVKHLDG